MMIFIMLLIKEKCDNKIVNYINYNIIKEQEQPKEEKKIKQ